MWAELIGCVWATDNADILYAVAQTTECPKFKPGVEVVCPSTFRLNKPLVNK